MADEVARPKIVFTGLPEGYQTSFWAEDFGIFIISSIAAKKDDPKCPLTNLGRFSRVRVFDYNVFDRIVYLQLPRANGPLTFAQYYSSSSSSSSSGGRSGRKRHASNYLMGTARAPFKSRTYGRNLSAL